MVQIPLDSFFNNKGFGIVPGEANFDQLGNSYPALNLPIGGSYVSTKTNISYLFPGYQGQNKSDNVVMAGQQIHVPSSSYFSLQMLLSAEFIGSSANMSFEYTDGTLVLTEVRTNPYSSFLSILKGEIVMPSYFTNNDTNFNTSHIFEYIGPLDPSKTLASITLPDTSNEISRIHLFSISLNKQSSVQVQFIRPTQKHDSNQVQTIELIINNSGPQWISGGGSEVSITGPGIQTVQPGYIKRLRPGDQKKINVGVIGSGNVTAQIHFTGSMNATFSADGVSFGLEEYTSELASLSSHESPEWFDQAKFGIFIRKSRSRVCPEIILMGMRLGSVLCAWLGKIYSYYGFAAKLIEFRAILHHGRSTQSGIGGTTITEMPTKRMCTTISANVLEEQTMMTSFPTSLRRIGMPSPGLT